MAAASSQAELIYGMTAAGAASDLGGIGLVSFDSTTPGSRSFHGNFAGVVSGHSVRSIDFRPKTGELYAISTDGGANAQLYKVNLATGQLTTVGGGFSLGTNTSARVEIDFNPVVDRIRIITGATETSGQANNFRANPDTGALVATDSNLTFAAGDPQFGATGFTLVAAAYSNNVDGAASTTLYGWDYITDSLVTVGGLDGAPSPNGGQMFTVNTPAGFLTGLAGIGMDISGATNTLYVTHDNPAGGPMALYTRNLTTGAETLIGAYGGDGIITDISVIPSPGAMAILSLAGLAFGRRNRRHR